MGAEAMEGQTPPGRSSGNARVCAVIVLALGCIALLALTSNGPAPGTKTQSLLTAQNAAKISAHATYDSEQVTYQAQMRAMRHLKGEYLKANSDLSTFFSEAVKKKFDITRKIAMSELDQAKHTANMLENKKKRLADEAHEKLLNAVDAAKQAS